MSKYLPACSVPVCESVCAGNVVCAHMRDCVLGSGVSNGVQARNYKIDTCCFLARRSLLLRHGYGWFAQCPVICLTGISGHSAGGMVCQWCDTIKLS